MNYRIDNDKEVNITSFSREECLKKIEKLSKSYVPEWLMDTDDPDVGSTLAMLAADGYGELAKRQNATLEREYVELVNMLGVSLKSAYPASGVVLLDVEGDTISGRRFPSGLRFVTEESEEEGVSSNGAVVFESQNSLFATSSKITHCFSSSVSKGEITVEKGQFPINVIPGKIKMIIDEETGEEIPEEDKDGEVILPASAHAFLICHEHAFDSINNRINIHFENAQKLFSLIKSGYVTVSLYSEEREFTPLTDFSINNNIFSFVTDKECGKLKIDNKEYTALLFEAAGAVNDEITSTRIGINSKSDFTVEPVVFDGTSDLNPTEFLPFNDSITLYSNCFIGRNDYFNKPGAKVTIEFDLDFYERELSFPKPEEDSSLPIVKRKPVKVIEASPAHVFAQEVSFEYYNGIGYKPLPVEEGFKTLFSTDKPRKVTMSFICPNDWKPDDMGAREMLSIRMRVMKADNCYYMPAIHHYPIIRGINISYSYDGIKLVPDKVLTFNYDETKDVTSSVADSDEFTLLKTLPFENNATYIGFNKPLEEGPISLLFDVDEKRNSTFKKTEIDYYNSEGATRLKIKDGTDNLSHSGIISFLPPSDMKKTKLVGVEKYWLRILNRDLATGEPENKAPEINKIEVNAVEISNIQTGMEDDYYIDESVANMSFSLTSKNILDATVWVNESGLHTEREMRRLLQDSGDIARADVDFRGNITRFFMKWTETDNFDLSNPGDRHYVLDRMNNRIHFGDGVSVMIPKITGDVAFRVILRSCDGENGNLPAGSITGSIENLIFVDGISNPFRTYGGMNMESLSGALKRGTGIINSRNRLISAMDYEREAYCFSSGILTCKAISGVDRDGNQAPGLLSLAVLMDDYNEGNSTFISMKERLRKHLLEKSDISVTEKCLDVVEPVWAYVNVELWGVPTGVGDTYEITEQLTNALNEFLDPALNPSLTIGNKLDKSRIELRLHMEKSKIRINKLLVTVTYTDKNGTHDSDINDLEANPYFIFISGNHKLHFLSE